MNKYAVPSSCATPDQKETVDVHIVGRNILQNELLIAFLESNMSVHCEQHEHLNPTLMFRKTAKARQIIMIDCQGRADYMPWGGFNINPMLDSSSPLITLYNVSPNSEIEFIAIEQGVRGIFFTQESFRIFPQAIVAILNGELWYSRKALSQWVIRGGNGCKLNPDVLACLTAREKEIFFMVVSGTENRIISESLCISPHTVKAHIYNIYGKLNLKNRIQASQWAAKYLNPSSSKNIYKSSQKARSKIIKQPS